MKIKTEERKVFCNNLNENVFHNFIFKQVIMNESDNIYRCIKYTCSHYKKCSATDCQLKSDLKGKVYSKDVTPITNKFITLK